MSKRVSGSVSPEKLAERLAEIKRQLEEKQSWPASADRLLDDLSQQSNIIPEPAEEEEDMLAFVVEDALKGFDISQRYPVFYRRLLQNAALRDAFLETLNAVESGRQGMLEPLPEAPNRNLEFLNLIAPHPAVELPEPGGWRLRWQLTAAHLGQLFRGPQPVFRDDGDFWEERWLTLLRSDVAVRGEQITVTLAVAQNINVTDYLDVMTTVGRTVLEPEEIELLPALRTELTWGSYTANTVIEGSQSATFPPLPLATIMDDSGKLRDADLQFAVENVR